MMEFLLIFHTLVMSGFIDINSGFIFASIYSVAIAHIALPLQAIHVCICTNEHTRAYILFCKFSGLLLLPFRNFTEFFGPQNMLWEPLLWTLHLEGLELFLWRHDGIHSSGGHWHTCLYLSRVMIMATSIAHTFVQLKDKSQKQLQVVWRNLQLSTFSTRNCYHLLHLAPATVQVYALATFQSVL